MSGQFLPDFCDRHTGFLLILVIELLAVLLTLASHPDAFWVALALRSLLMQWIALLCAVVLCQMGPWLSRQHAAVVTIAVFFVSQLCTFGAVMGASHLDTAPPPLWATQAISAIIALLALRYFYLQHQAKQHLRAEARARLDALQARIHPHFLFNTLNTIAGLIHRKPDAAEQAVLDLADLLRAALATHTAHTLGEELALIRRYLAIEHLRFGDKLQVAWHIEGELPEDCNMPALLIQPLVENALHHGIQHRPEGGCLTLSFQQEASVLRVTISNPQATMRKTATTGQHMAQQNIRERLQLTYGLSHPLTVIETDDHYHVCLTLPFPSCR